MLLCHRKKGAVNTMAANIFLNSAAVTLDQSEIDNRNLSEAHQTVRELFSEYCDNTTIHGVKYLAERKRPFRER